MESHVNDVDWDRESEHVDEGSLEWRRVACHPCEVLDVAVDNEIDVRSELSLDVGCQYRLSCCRWCVKWLCRHGLL